MPQSSKFNYLNLKRKLPVERPKRNYIWPLIDSFGLRLFAGLIYALCDCANSVEIKPLRDEAILEIVVIVFPSARLHLASSAWNN